jgi:putative transcriptional regulator
MQQQMSSLGKRLVKSAKEARTIARGEADASTYKIYVPATIDVKAIRARRGLTQEEFCVRYGLNCQS